MKKLITNKNGTTFEREMKVKNYDTKLWARFNSTKKSKLDAIAEEQGMSTSVLTRKVMEKYIEDYENGINR